MVHLRTSFTLGVLCCGFFLGGCQPSGEQLRLAERQKTEQLVHEARENERHRQHQLELQARELKARNEDNENSRRVWSKVVSFATGALTLFLTSGLALMVMAFIKREVLLRDVRKHQVSEQEATKRAIASAAAKEVFANWSQLSGPQQELFLRTQGGGGSQGALS